MDLLRQIENEAIDGSSDLGTVLRRALMLAYRSNYGPLREWVEHELNGYPRGARLPEYRVVPASAYGSIVNYQAEESHVLSITLTGDTTDSRLAVCHLEVSALSLVDHVSNNKHSYNNPIPSDMMPLAERLVEGTTDWDLDGAWYEIAPRDVQAIINAVRTTVLRMALEMEKFVQAGETEEDKPQPISTDQGQQIFYAIFPGDGHNIALGSPNASQTQQHLIVQQGNIQSLRGFLSSSGIDVDDISAIERALEAGADSPGESELSHPVRDWLSQMTIKAAKGAIRITAEQVTQAVMRYVGLP